MQPRHSPRKRFVRFLVDENLPLSLVRFLRESGHHVLDVAASPIRGSSDEQLWKRAAREEHILVTRDLDFPFPKIRPYPSGLIIVRVPDTFTGEQITRIFSEAIKRMQPEDLEGSVTVITPGRIRIRKMG